MLVAHVLMGDRYMKLAVPGQATRHYNKALSQLKLELAKCYFNKATALSKVGGLDEEVVRNCTAALEEDPLYAKALYLRAITREQMKLHTAALEDIFTYIWVTGDDSKTLVPMKRLCSFVAAAAQDQLDTVKEIRTTKKFSPFYLLEFCSCYYNDPLWLKFPADSFIGRAQNIMQRAVNYELNKKEQNNWIDHIVELCCKELNPAHKSRFRVEALLMRGSIYVLSDEVELAKADLEEVFNDETAGANFRAQAAIKMADMYLINRMIKEEALTWCDRATVVDPSSVDVVYFMYKRFTSRSQTWRAEKEVALMDDSGLFARFVNTIQVHKVLNKNGREFVPGELVILAATPCEPQVKFQELQRRFPNNLLALVQKCRDFCDVFPQRILDEIDQAIAKNKKNAVLQTLKGYMYMVIHPNVPDGERWFNRAHQLDPYLVTHLLPRAMWVLRNTWDYPTVQNHLEHILSMDRLANAMECLPVLLLLRNISRCRKEVTSTPALTPKDCMYLVEFVYQDIDLAPLIETT